MTRRPRGTGFFVAPGIVVTCDHVIRDVEDVSSTVEIVDAHGSRSVDHVEHLSPREEDDLALLYVEPWDHMCVLLDQNVRERDEVYTFGFPEKQTSGVPTLLVVEGQEGPPKARWKLARGQVQPGMSGSAVLNERTGCVFGVLRMTRDWRQDLGGFAIPITALLKHAATLKLLNDQYHGNDPAWLSLLSGAQQGGGRAPEEAPKAKLVLTIKQVGENWEAVATPYTSRGAAEDKIAEVDLDGARAEVARLFRDWALRGRVDEREQVTLLGGILYRALFRGEIKRSFEKLLPKSGQDRLLVALHFERGADPNLFYLPWEHLYLEEREMYFATAPNLAFCRVLEPEPEPVRAPVPGRKLSVLLVTVKRRPDVDERQNGNYPAWAVDRIKEALVAQGTKQGFEVEPLEPATLVSIARELGRRRYDVLHYVGFGRFDGVDELAFAAETREGVEYVSGAALAASLDEGQPTLVVLQTVHGAPLAVPADCAEFAPTLLTRGVAAVVAFQYPAAQAEPSIAFNERLYSDVSAGAFVHTAVQQARNSMGLAGQRAFVSPALFLRVPEALRLTTPAAEALVVQAASALVSG